MARRGYSTVAASYRPRRTKIYDSNYLMTEASYRSAIDQLDRKQSGRVTREEPPAPIQSYVEERISPPRRNRPLSAAEIESTWAGPGPAPRLEEAEPSFEELMDRIKAARARTAHAMTAQDHSYDSTFMLRREDLAKKHAEKVLDSIGINGEMEERRTVRPQVVTATPIPVMMDDPAWPALTEMGESAAEVSARARARQSRARLADLDAEMVEMEQRGVARERRMAAVRQLLSSSDSQSSESVRHSKKVTVSEKRTTAAY